MGASRLGRTFLGMEALSLPTEYSPQMLNMGQIKRGVWRQPMKKDCPVRLYLGQSEPTLRILKSRALPWAITPQH
jgi:hypothetical protein